MLTIFQLFAVRSEASVLRMCEGSPDTYLHTPILKYLTDRGVKINLKTRVTDLIHDVRAARRVAWQERRSGEGEQLL